MSDSSGLGAFEALNGVGVVVEATVTEEVGSALEPRDDTGFAYEGRSDSSSDWRTPFGLPVLVLNDVKLVASVGGSSKAETLGRTISAAVDSGTAIQVLAPVGVYEKGARYQFWLSPWDEKMQLTYLVFNDREAPIDGLDIPNLEASIERLMNHTGSSQLDSLTSLAREFNVYSEQGERGELLEFLYAPTAPADSVPPSQFFPTVDDDPSIDTRDVRVEVFIEGAPADSVLGLRGTLILGWSIVGDDGTTMLRGWVPAGERLQLVRELTPGGEVQPIVADPAAFVTVTRTDEDAARAHLVLSNGEAKLRENLSRSDLDTAIQNATSVHAPEAP